MSLPREVLPGRTYLVTRRCTQRQFLMRPDKETNNAFIYCLAVAAERYNVDVLFTVAMSNHHHTGIRDRHGNYPEFLQCFHKLFAKCQNALRGRWENFWSNEQTSMVRLVTSDDVLNKLVYSVCNPVQAHLVERANDWIGVSSYQAHLRNEHLRAVRPEHFFRKNGSMPAMATLRFSRPEGFVDMTHNDWKKLIETRVRQVERDVRRRLAFKGKRVVGIEKVSRQPWSGRPRQPDQRRGLNPRISSKNKWRRMETVQINRRFLDAYRAAREAFSAGLQTVLFPLGTYWLKKTAGVLCERMPDSFVT